MAYELCARALLVRKEEAAVSMLAACGQWMLAQQTRVRTATPGLATYSLLWSRLPPPRRRQPRLTGWVLVALRSGRKAAGQA
eukprot:1208571-Lingulodinium_polyedra.AAC.1